MTKSKNSSRQFVRLTRNQRIQHVVLLVSTTVLILTGFMLQADRWLIDSFGSSSETIFWWRGWIHRISGVIVTGLCVYHLIYVVVSDEGKSWFSAMVPKKKDITDTYQNITYMLGLRQARPKMDRFAYLEKLEYWSVYFGMSLIITTGIIMWTEQLWPKLYLDVAAAVHLGEATLAVLAIIVGHIFSVHFNPHVYPMNRAFIDGMISKELMKEEHELWYEREITKTNNTNDRPIGTPDSGAKPIMKKLATDAIMTLILVVLLALSAWVVWVYYFRGAIDIETRGFISTTEFEQPVKPTQVEAYTLRHFHNLDEVVLGGIQSESLCVKCHGDYSHSKSKKARTFFNAHSWFMACEVCHVRPKKGEKVSYRWLDNNTGKEVTALQGQSGNYGARIIPIKMENKIPKRLDDSADKEFIEEYMRTKDGLDEDKQKFAMDRIHNTLTKSPLYCDKCHTDNGVLDFRKLLYSKEMAMHLETIDMGSMIENYKEFYLPNIFDPKK